MGNGGGNGVGKNHGRKAGAGIGAGRRNGDGNVKREIPTEGSSDPKRENPTAVALGRLGGIKSGKTRTKTMTAAERNARAGGFIFRLRSCSFAPIWEYRIMEMRVVDMQALRTALFLLQCRSGEGILRVVLAHLWANQPVNQTACF
jgi:hypothetical protein